MPSVEVEALTGELKRVFAENARALLAGGKEDLERYGRDIFRLMLGAAKTGNEEAMAHVKAQVSLLAEMLRLRGNEAALRTLEAVVETLVRVLIGVRRLAL